MQEDDSTQSDTNNITANTTAKAFIARWQGVNASELSTAQSFVRELCELLGVQVPHTTPEQNYMFERPITFSHGDGSTSPGRIDCYLRGHFVLESKKLKSGPQTKGFDDALLRARAQAEGYARALPPKGSFQQLLQSHREQPQTLQQMLRVLWTDMDSGGFSAALATQVLRFNGKLFKQPMQDGYSLLLNQEQIERLIRAAQANWREVEPATFGTLLERALDPTERHALGAHYTPRAYVERLVLPTVVEPLRADWANAQAAALVLAREAAELSGKAQEAKQEGRSAHRNPQVSPPALQHPRAGPGLRQRKFSVRHAGAFEAPGRRSHQPAQ
jgi:hypothetical protein